MTPDAKSAASDIRMFIGLGLALGLVGGLIAGLTWPHTSTGLLGLEEHGSRAGVLFGLVLSWAGNVMLAVGLIAQGVRMGRNASPSRAD